MDKTIAVEVGNVFYEFLSGPAAVKTLSLCNRGSGIATVEFKFKKPSSESSFLVRLKKSSVFKGGDFQFFLESDDSVSVKSDSDVHMLCSYSSTVTTSTFSGTFSRSSDGAQMGELNWGLVRGLLRANLPNWGS
jgi:hypothetical protein